MQYVLLLLPLVLAQTDQDLLNQVFRSNFSQSVPGNEFDGDEVITQAPLRDLKALNKCGEGDQFERFACVPYYNCDPNTNTVTVNPDYDGTNKIEIRMRAGEEYKCSHYLEVCCQLPNNTNEDVVEDRVTPPPSSGSTASTTAFCGIRNSQGLDFNFTPQDKEAFFGEFPWMVAILNKDPGPGGVLSICGGSLITPRVVLTGAHCVRSRKVSEIKVRAGEWDTQTTHERIPYQERDVLQKILRFDFSHQNLYNDLALLVLERSFAKAASVGTICLPQQDQELDSKDCFATGWGKNLYGREGQYAVVLKKIQLGLVQHRECERALRTTRLGPAFGLHSSFICAGGEPGVDTCTGDGGSPLVCPDPNNPSRYLQAGIVAWGIGCGSDGIPGVYADVTKFRHWVDTKLRDLNISTRPYE